MAAKTDQTLERLISSGRCSCANVNDYAKQLTDLADEKADRGDAKKRVRFFKALGDETRQRMLSMLLERDMCVCELIAALKIPQPTISHHLGILANSELVVSRKEGKWVFYSIPDREKVKALLKMVD